MKKDKQKNKQKEPSSIGGNEILVTAQQSRFHADAIEDPASKNVCFTV